MLLSPSAVCWQFLLQGGGGMCHYSHAVVGLYEVTFSHSQFLHTCTAPSQTDILFGDLRVHSEVLNHCTQHWDNESWVLDMLQDEWWLSPNIFQCIYSGDTGTGGLDMRSWDGCPCYDVTRTLPLCILHTCWYSEGQHIHMLWGGCPGIVGLPSNHNHFHRCYTWP